MLCGICSMNTMAQQNLDAYVQSPGSNIFTVVSSSTNALSTPVDLDFYPDQSSRPFELWLLNQGTYNTGGNTVIVTNANKSTRKAKYVKDGNAWHFMAMASAIAFANDEWATSADILDANRSGGKYTGPTLWPGDLSVYGIVGNPSSSQINGSHLSMIHQSPYSKGIAFEKDLIFWVLDGYEGNIKRYDFGNPHQPGGADHSGGGVRVYSDFNFTKHATLPSHIVIDANRKYLYGCDPVGKRVFRIDITTGTDFGSAVKVNTEKLVEYREYTGLEMKNVVTTGLKSPVGIDIYGDRLIVTDNGTDEIIIYSISNNFSEVGRIKLSYTNPDPMGVKVGPDGKIYYVDYTNKKAYMIDNNAVWPLAVNEVSTPANTLSVYPNPVASSITLQSNLDLQNAQVKIINLLGEEVFNQWSSNTTLDVSGLSKGLYILQVKTNNKFLTQKFMKQ